MLPKRTLMGPGPSDVSSEVLEAMARPTIGHLDPAFVEFMDELNELLRMAFKTKNPITLPISAPGSAGMECCFVNLLEPGDKVVIAVNGVFGGRMVDVATRYGATAVPVEFEWGAPVDPNKMEDALKAHPESVSAIGRPAPTAMNFARVSGISSMSSSGRWANPGGGAATDSTPQLVLTCFRDM